MNAKKTDIYQRVTDQIVEAIEQGVEKFKLPWRTLNAFPMSPINASTRRPYSGINILVLWATADKRGYSSGLWATYKQWSDLGAQVRRGEKAANVVFAQIVEREAEEGKAGETGTKTRRFPFLREYHVFNVAQVDGYSEPHASTPAAKRIEHADSFFSSVDMLIENGMNSAFYDAVADMIYMPPFESFTDPLMYYSVLSHESIHWTGAEHRLNRRASSKFGSSEYAFEELIAELGAAFLCSFLGLPTDPRTDHAPYINNWLSALKNDKRAIFRAAARAQEAVDWIKDTATRGLEAA